MGLFKLALTLGGPHGNRGFFASRAEAEPKPSRRGPVSRVAWRASGLRLPPRRTMNHPALTIPVGCNADTLAAGGKPLPRFPADCPEAAVDVRPEGRL